MSGDNVEALKRAAEANNRRDYEAFLEEFDPDIEWHGIFGLMFGVEATIVRNHEGLLGYVRDLDEGFSVREVQFTDFRDLGDRIVALGHVLGRGRESGIEFDSPYGVWPSSRTASASGTATTSTTPKRSKPPGCGSRQSAERPTLPVGPS